MKTVLTRMTERGQVSVPAAIRRAMHMESGCHLLWRQTAEHECVVTIQHTRQRQSAAAMRGYAASFRERRRTLEWMKDLRGGEQD